MTQQPRGGRRGIRSFVGSIVAVLVAFGLIGYGGYETWLQHSGIAASVHLKAAGAGVATCRPAKEFGSTTERNRR
jgi:hypothetical protein